MISKHHIAFIVFIILIFSYENTDETQTTMSQDGE